MKRHLPSAGPSATRTATRLGGLLALCLVAVAVWTAGAPASPSGGAGCTEGMTRLKGVDVRVFCGPARATVKFAGKTYHVKNGSCLKTPGGGGFGIAFTVNVGMQQLPPPPAATPRKFSYFGVGLEKAKGGTYSNQVVGIAIAGKANLSPLENKVVISKNLKKGSFTGMTSLHVNGKLLPKKVPISGSWTC
ncbi:MAG TPA: hypothetical protein VNH40_01545 [Gaiellaceae bacterium]|nr:hypothetical protein [Gaiellaceae bacterium]